VKKKRLLILSARSEYSWWSCRTIGRNLRAAYGRLGDGLVVSTLEMSTGSGSGPRYERSFRNDFVRAIRDFKPDEFVVTDTSPHPFELFSGIVAEEPAGAGDAVPLQAHGRMRSLLEPLGMADKPWTFHVYGDFTYSAIQWSGFGNRELAQGLPIRLVCASPRQSALVGRLVNDASGGRVRYVPFPVDCDAWAFDERLRAEARRELRVPDSSKVILYTGRLSVQKNVTTLVREFARLVDGGDSKSQLWLVGPYDDRDGLIMSLDAPAGYFFRKLNGQLAGLPGSVRKRIRVFDPMTGSDLRKMYCAADVYASLSLYHDEDFGMAPAEALSAGLPAVLSDWGGYSGFAVEGVACGTVPVRLADEGLVMESDAIQKALQGALGLAGRDSGALRARRGGAFARLFSIDAVAEMLPALFEERPGPFAGFNARLKLLAERVGGGRPHADFYPASGSFYEEIYRPYFSGEEAR